MRLTPQEYNRRIQADINKRLDNLIDRTMTMRNNHRMDIGKVVQIKNKYGVIREAILLGITLSGVAAHFDMCELFYGGKRNLHTFVNELL
jgi:hypothetical protein